MDTFFMILGVLACVAVGISIIVFIQRHIKTLSGLYMGAVRDRDDLKKQLAANEQRLESMNRVSDEAVQKYGALCREKQIVDGQLETARTQCVALVAMIADIDRSPELRRQALPIVTFLSSNGGCEIAGKEFQFTRDSTGKIAGLVPYDSKVRPATAAGG